MLDHISLDVSDIEKNKTFYLKALTPHFGMQFVWSGRAWLVLA